MSGAPLVGLLGGTFDPVHEGHLRLGEAAQRALHLARLVWLPAGQPWQKSEVSGSDDRVAMLSLALVARPQRHAEPDALSENTSANSSADSTAARSAAWSADWSIDTREAQRSGASYTIDTVRELRAEFGPTQPLVWILGSDQLHGLPSWKRWQDLLDFVHIAYAQRPGSTAQPAPVMREYLRAHAGSIEELASRPAGTTVAFPMNPFDCSSTAIRASIARGHPEDARALVPAPVFAYIQSHRLYVQAHGQ